jgi:uncharacterized repeat protein (TIGR03803 family)
MRRSNLRHYAISSCVAAALLVGCGGSQPPIGAPGAMPQGTALASARTVAPRAPTSPAYKVVHYFNYRAASAGWNPQTGLLDVNDTLYGTTFTGEGTVFGGGTVYSMNMKGAVTVLHKFTGPADGREPDGDLIDVNGTLYGTTISGGNSDGNGTVYGLSASGAETVLYRFSSGNSDGANPSGPLVDVDGTLYGTTQRGGSCDCGTVYSISTTGAEKVLHFFSGGSDGSVPVAGLIDVKGTLYGTTYFGGSTGCHGNGCGIVFSISTTGQEKVLYSFLGSDGNGDGGYPASGLLDVHGTLYGTTAEGGSYACGKHLHCGTVYSVTRKGKEKVLYSFHNAPDGATPNAALINFGGTLYGTTSRAGSRPWPQGDGTIYSITTSGSEQVLHVFNEMAGRLPTARLTQVSSKLYGTTSRGGIPHSRCGGRHIECGLVFAFTP